MRERLENVVYGDTLYESIEIDTECREIKFTEYDKETGMRINLICVERDDTAERHAEFWRLLARPAAEFYKQKLAAQ